MTAFSLLLVLLSAALHATWNLLAKESRNKAAFFSGMLLSVVVLAAPAFAYLFWQKGIPQPGWYLLAATGAFNAAYYLCLGKAYEEGDLSLVYPLARGIAPVLVPALAWLALGERISAQGAIGIGVVFLGIGILHLKSASPEGLLEPFRALRSASARFALATGTFTALYSVVDKSGVAIVHPFLYIYVMFAFSATWVTLANLHRGKDWLWGEWRGSSWRMALAGGLCMLAYLLILIALTVSKVSYVTAARSINVILGAALGSLVLREPYGKMRLAGALLIFAGVALIGLAK